MGATREDDSGGEAPEVRSPSLLRNFLSLLSGRFIGDLALFLLFVVLSRTFGEEGIGQYSFATVVGGLALILADFGLRTYTLKEVGRHREEARDRYWQIVASWLANSAITFGGLVPLVLLMPITEEAKWILILICSAQLLLGLTSAMGVLFVAHERMELGALFESCANWLVALSAVSMVFLEGSLVAVSATIASAYMISAICALLVAFRYFQIQRGGFSLAVYGTLLREALPFALRQILRQVTIRMDILFIGVLLGPAEVGAYAVAYRLIYMLFLMFNLVGIAIFPASARLFEEGREEFLRLAQQALGVVILISVPAAVGLALVAAEVIRLVFGSAFDTSIGLLQMLAILVAFFPLGMMMQNLLDCADRQVMTLNTEAVGVVCGLIAHSVLIPLFGLKGAVVASILSEVAVVGTAAYGTRDIIRWPRLAGRFAIALLGSAALAALFFLLPTVSGFILIVPAVAVYAAVVLCFRDLRRQELGALIGLLRKS